MERKVKSVGMVRSSKELSVKTGFSVGFPVGRDHETVIDLKKKKSLRFKEKKV